MTTPTTELYETHFHLAQKYARQENFELAYFAMIEAYGALLDTAQNHLQEQLRLFDELVQAVKPEAKLDDPVI